jgi:hypothetical protein
MNKLTGYRQDIRVARNLSYQISRYICSRDVTAKNLPRVLKLGSSFKRPSLLTCFFLISVGGEHSDDLKVRSKL